MPASPTVWACRKARWAGFWRGRDCRAGRIWRRASRAARDEHEHPGDLLHIDTKKLGRIVRMGHRVTGDPRDRVDGAGWEFLFVAVDDHARIGFTQIHPDECQDSAVEFLRASRTYFAGLGVTLRRVLTDNGLRDSLQGVRGCLSPVAHRAQFHLPLSTANQWQGRTLHSVGIRDGICASLIVGPPSVPSCSSAGRIITTASHKR